MGTIARRDQSLQLTKFRRELAKATEPEQALMVGAGVSGIEEAMRKSGLYRLDQIRPVRELFLDSRWTLGHLLDKLLRGKPGPQKDNSRAGNYLRDELKRLGLDKNRASEAHRIGALPEDQKTRAYRDAEKQDILPTVSMLVERAKPYWHIEQRKQKHRKIAERAIVLEQVKGPFALVYADPPWRFETYSEKAVHLPDDHYPTLSDDEIKAFRVGDRALTELVTRDAVLFLWCTSANLVRALAVMSAWGFEYRTHAVWDKERTGTGFVFRNRHEVLLYGIRGNMPGPQFQPDSVFRFKRGAHSAKPVEIQIAIERMFPDFDERTRIELFSRRSRPGWSVDGNEAAQDRRTA